MKADKHHELRRACNFSKADLIRDKIESDGFEIRDHHTNSIVLQRSRVEWKGYRKEISSSREVPSLLEEPDRYEVTISLVAHNNWPELKRCYESVRVHTSNHRVQVVIVEGGSTDETREQVAKLAQDNTDTVLWYADHPLGEGAFRNVTLRQALGSIVVLLDVSVEFIGDIVTPITRTLHQ